jgi:hypothetical protein
VDETGWHSHSGVRRKGWAKIGHEGIRLTDTRHYYNGGGQNQRHVIAAMSMNGVRWPFVGCQATRADGVWREWVHQIVVDTVQGRLPPRCTFIMDSCRAHGCTREAGADNDWLGDLQKAPCHHQVFFLPGYSPYMNPIEMLWGWAKGQFKAHMRPMYMEMPELSVVMLLEGCPQQNLRAYIRKAGVDCLRRE